MNPIRRIAGRIFYAFVTAAWAYTPRLAAKVLHLHYCKRLPNLKYPTTFAEKLLWLRLNTYRNNRQIVSLLDKYEVREYVKSRGCEDTLNELYFVCEDVNDVPWDNLPDSFALKLSQGCTTNILCPDKSRFDIGKAREQLDGWMRKRRVYMRQIADIGGMRPREVKNHIICEKYLKTSDGTASPPSDYKLYCFNGEPRAVLYIEDRYGNKKGCFMSVDWQWICNLDGGGAHYETMEELPALPRSLSRMLSAARALSEPFPFVRVDFYDIDGSAVFGEMTFFPGSLVGASQTDIDGVSMGEMLRLPIE